jgi:hypothetical protein
MEWLRKLFRSPSSSARRIERDEDLIRVNWHELEATLVRLAKRVISRFASEHTTETFSSLGFDCTAEWGQVLICLTTQPVGDGDRWEFGNWEYHGINLGDEEWNSEWEQFELQMQARAGFLLDEKRGKELPELTEQFMVSATRALADVRESEEMSTLKLTPEFEALCIDHDESSASAQERTARIL